jgi:hypothetical protein
VDYLLFRGEKELAGVQLTPESLEKSWNRLKRTIDIDKFIATSRWWLDGCNNCIRLCGRYIEKAEEINTLLINYVIIYNFFSV